MFLLSLINPTYQDLPIVLYLLLGELMKVTGGGHWQRVGKRGDYPSPRCGAAISVHWNKALLFGGVYDQEGK